MPGMSRNDQNVQLQRSMGKKLFRSEKFHSFRSRSVPPKFHREEVKTQKSRNSELSKDYMNFFEKKLQNHENLVSYLSERDVSNSSQSKEPSAFTFG